MHAGTAIDVPHGPRVANELMCGRMGQAVLAGTVLAPRESWEYVKISCLRERADSAHAKEPRKADSPG